MIHIEKITGLLDFHISPSASVGSSMASSQSAPDPADAWLLTVPAVTMDEHFIISPPNASKR